MKIKEKCKWMRNQMILCVYAMHTNERKEENGWTLNNVLFL